MLPPEDRYASVVREVLQGELVDQILYDKAWPTLAGTLADAEQLGAKPANVLSSAAGQRELSSAEGIAEVLAFRVD